MEDVSGGAATLATGVAKDALCAAGALDDARSGTEPDHGPCGPLLVPEGGDTGVQASAFVRELGVRHLGEVVEHDAPPVGQLVDLVFDLS